MNKIIISTLFICYSIITISQEQNFSTDYELSVCKGELPSDFSVDILEKTKSDVASETYELTPSKKNKFYENSNYYIYNFLNGGKVLFGDEMTNYVNQVANTLLEKSDNLSLKSELKFYVLKSNVVNAVCMPDGSIFVTVGLLSQIESEAQLAFVLAHEISHYTLQHGIKTYANNEKLRTKYNRSKIGYDDAIVDLSEYSKNQELESDDEGYKMFVKAGYDSDEALKMLLVLQYSHLPFDEIKFDEEFFNSDKYKIPSEYFKNEKLTEEIEDNSGEDDTYSSHPNIKTRIENLNKKKSEEGLVTYGVGLDFEYIQTKARFETQYLNIIQRKYIKTIYESYLLKKKYPNNKFLDECIAKSLYAISKNKTNENSLTEEMELEGNTKSLVDLFDSKMDKKEINVLALKLILELNPEAFQPYAEDLAMDLIKRNGMSLNSFYFNDSKPKTDTTKGIKTDSVNTIPKVVVPEFKLLDSVEYAALTKVGKIKYNRAKQKHYALMEDTSKNDLKVNTEPVKSDYYKTAFYHKKNDSYLKKIFKIANERDLPKYFEDLSYSEQYNAKAERDKEASKFSKVKMDSIIIIDANYEIYKRSGGFDIKNSYKLENIMSDNINELSENSDVSYMNLMTTNFENLSIDQINANFLIKEWKTEMNESYDKRMLSLTQDRINTVFSSLGYNKVMAIGVHSSFNPMEWNQAVLARWLPLISLVMAPGVWPLHIVRFNKYDTIKYLHIIDKNGYNILYRKFESNKGVNAKQDEMFLNNTMNQITK